MDEFVEPLHQSEIFFVACTNVDQRNESSIDLTVNYYANKIEQHFCT